MVRPERGWGVKGHAFGDVVVGGVVVDDRLRDGERGQSCYGDHGGGGHHGVEDERQAVGHVPVGGAGQSWSVTWGETAEEVRLKTPYFIRWTVSRRLQQEDGDLPFSSTANTLAPFPSSSWTTTVNPFLAATCSGLQGRCAVKTGQKNLRLKSPELNTYV